MTDVEIQLWRRLQRRQMGTYKFRRQHPFGDYILDFVCLDAMLVIEVDGGQHAQNANADKARTEHLIHAGFRVLRFWNSEILEDIDAVSESIWKALRAPSPPQSSP